MASLEQHPVSGSAIVTGAAQGLGMEIARALLVEGWKVCLADINGERGPKTAEEFGKIFGEGNVIFHRCDVTKEESFKETFCYTATHLGYVSLLVNNAGIGFGESWRKVYDVNLNGPTIGMELAFKHMGVDQGARGGTIVNIASLAGLRGVNISPHYSATKAGLVMLSRTLGTDLYFNKTKVRVLCLCPCSLDTELYHRSIAVLDEAFKRELEQILQSFPPIDPKVAADIVVKMVKTSPNGHVIRMNPDGSHETADE